MYFFYDGEFILDKPVDDFLRFDGDYLKYEDDGSMRLIDVYGNHILPEEYHYNRLLVINENMFFVRFDDKTKEISSSIEPGLMGAVPFYSSVCFEDYKFEYPS